MANQNFNQTNQNKQTEKPITRPISKDFDKKTYQSSESDKARDFKTNVNEKTYTNKNKAVNPDFDEDYTVERGGMDDDAER